MTSREQINCMALAMMFANRGRQLLLLYKQTGSATAIVDHADNLRSIAPALNPEAFLIDAGQLKVCLEQATAEAEFAEKNGIAILTPDDPRYPKRLYEVCDDAPLALYLCGNADLNSQRILSIVGTRRSTDYGLDMVNNIVGELAQYFPDLLIVSGLAYGTDINAHRAALSNGLPTVGVLAHGLDRIYPATHRQTATRMTQHGGLLTEFPSTTKIDPLNFLRRNRLIAALAQGTLVVESKSHGGALTTARHALEYNLAVMACPGRATDIASEGCNRLIATNGAALVSSAADIVQTLGWKVPKQQAPALPSLFADNLNAEEKLVFDTLTLDPRHFSDIVSATGLAVPTVLSVLSELEFRGLARQLPGSNWRKNHSQ